MSYFYTDSSIIGGPLDSAVLKQLEKRSDIIGKKAGRTTKDIQFLNSNTAWVKLMSSVNTYDKETGTYTSKLAQKYTLLGGTLNKEGKIKEGFQKFGKSTLPNSSYEKSSIQGFIPMPGIESFAISTKNDFGTLRLSTVEFTAYSLEQLTDLEQLYFRPGFTVLLQWGHSIFVDNSGNVQNNIDYSIKNEFYSYTSPDEITEAIKKAKKESNNNYDGLFGFVKNFTWALKGYGLYSCKVDIISAGELIESVQALIHSSSANNSDEDKGDPPTDKDGNTAKNQNLSPLTQFLNAFLNSNDSSVEIADNSVVDAVKSAIEYKGRKFRYYKIEKLGGLESSLIVNEAFTFVPLSHILEAINIFFCLKSTNGNIVQFYTEKELKTPFITFPAHYMLNPNIGFLPKKNSATSLVYTEGSKFGYHFAGMAGDDGETTDILNICVNVQFALDVLTQVCMDSRSENQTIINFIESILDSIQDECGQINEFGIHYEEDSYHYYIVDRNLTPAVKKESRLDIVGLRSYVEDLSIVSKLTNDITNMVAVSAQASATDVGDELLSMQRWNIGLEDRIYPKKHVNPALSNAEPKILVQKLYEHSRQLEVDYQDSKTPRETAVRTELHRFAIRNNLMLDISGLKSLHRKLMNEFINYLSNEKSVATPGLIPLTLNLTMLGIGGVKIGQSFTVPSEVLPGSYSKDGEPRIAFIITKLDHKIDRGRWLTDIGGKMILIDGNTKPTVNKVDFEDVEATIIAESDAITPGSIPEETQPPNIPFNGAGSIRSDSAGQGVFSSPRGGRYHRGTDLYCKPNTFIYAPFDSTITYGLTESNLPLMKFFAKKDSGYEGFVVQYNYVRTATGKPLTECTKGQVVGIMESLAYNGKSGYEQAVDGTMWNHLDIKAWYKNKRIDPAELWGGVWQLKHENGKEPKPLVPMLNQQGKTEYIQQ